MKRLLDLASFGALLVAGLAKRIASPRRAYSTPRDVELLARGASRWEPLGLERGRADGLLDAALLADGRLACTSVVTFEPASPRPADLWDPRARRWSRGTAVVPPRLRPALSLSHDASTRWASLGDGRALVLKKHFAGEARARLEPGAVALPRLSHFPDAFAAAELPSGVLLVATRLAGRLAALRLPLGAAAWEPLPPPPVAFPAELHAGPAEGAVLEGLGERCLLREGTWALLPPLREERSGAVYLVLADGAVIAAGGLCARPTAELY